MKKGFLLFVILIIISNEVFPQIESRIYSEKSLLFDLHPQFEILRHSYKDITLPALNNDSLLNRDISNSGYDSPFAFGTPIQANYSIDDGTWTKVDSGMVWCLSFYSPNAYSLNFILSELYLPQGAEFYIFEFGGEMLYGPVTKDQNLEKGVFLTDIIKGNRAVLYIYCKESNFQNLKLSISKIIHGYIDIYDGIFETNSNSKSGSCEQNVACYPSWTNESEGIVQILLTSGFELGTGSLLNNTAHNRRAYILTAFHNIDNNPKDYTISPSEKTIAENWSFKFHYKTTTCEGGEIHSVTIYDRCSLKAAWDVSDFALMELRQSPLEDHTVSFLGWDITESDLSEVATIHHPSGDVMKISLDYESPTTQYNDVHWFVDDWAIGSTESGSSGAPLFNQSKKVIGQLHMSEVYPACHPDKGTFFGKLSSSWSGGGTDTTRLIDWLDPIGGYSSLGTYKRLYITGPDKVCEWDTVFTLNNLMPGYSVQWTNSSNLQPVSGQYSSTYVVKSTGSGSGVGGWVKATITNYDNISTEKDIAVVGTPYINPATIQFQCTEGSGYFCTNAFGNEFSFDYSSSYEYFDIKLTNLNETQTFAQFRIYGTWGTMDCFVSDGTYMFHVRGNNYCGTSTNWSKKAVEYVDCVGGGLFSLDIYPNPATEQATITIVSTEDKDANTKKVDEEWQLEVYTQGQLLKHSVPAINDNKYILNTSGWKPGMYFIRAYYKEKVVFGTLVVNE